MVELVSNLKIKRVISAAEAKAFGRIIPFVPPEMHNCLSGHKSASLLRTWHRDPSLITMPNIKKVAIEMKVPQSNNQSVFYLMNLSELNSKKNFIGPAGMFKWTLYMDLARQMNGSARMIPSAMWKLIGKKAKELNWMTIFAKWPSVLLLDSFIFLETINNGISSYKGNREQVHLARKLGISHLGQLFSAISALGYNEYLQYNDINLPVRSVEGFYDEMIRITGSGKLPISLFIPRLKSKGPEAAKKEFEIILAENKKASPYKKNGRRNPATQRRFNENPVAAIFRNAAKHSKQLSEEEQREYGTKAKSGDKSAKRILIYSCLRFVISVAHHYHYYGMQCTGNDGILPDLIQEGYKGLIKAAEKYDPEKGTLFITYAVQHIRQTILKFIKSQSRTIRKPGNMEGAIHKLRGIYERFLQTYRYEPTEEELAHEAGMKVGDLKIILAASQNPESLEMSIKENDKPLLLGQRIKDRTVEEPDTEVLQASLREGIEKGLSRLTKTESDVVRLISGLSDGNPKTGDEVGEMLGLTGERIRQIKITAYKKLKHMQLMKELNKEI